ncbi:IS1595 family transposase [Fulvivirga maritima]|uniref:IS1595 family transposase n=1 Tax=Fulvivirga maritima TaxID=2904247 RepID=UPI001F2AFEF7|nr:IS1595 family transposase [Fulvivirga maritima]UII25346.1 IS1595 family transposase [Fulvivirga maritima]
MFTEFKDTSLLKFIDYFDSDQVCLNYLAKYKHSKEYECKKCGHRHFWPGKKMGRVCKSCRYSESVTANTLFHKLKFNLRKAFYILFEMSTTSKSVSSIVMAQKYEITQKTAWLFMSKVRRAMSSSGQFSLTGQCEVDELLSGGKRKGKTGRGAANKEKVAVVIEKQGKTGVKRMYALRIANFSTEQLGRLFSKHISPEAEITTDLWSGYKPLKKVYKITSQKSDPGENFNLIHRCIQQLKGWLRGIHHSVSGKHLQGYLDEYCYRFNRHSSKDTAFDSLVQRMIMHPPVPKKMLDQLYCLST